MSDVDPHSGSDPSTRTGVDSLGSSSGTEQGAPPTSGCAPGPPDNTAGDAIVAGTEQELVTKGSLQVVLRDTIACLQKHIGSALSTSVDEMVAKVETSVFPRLERAESKLASHDKRLDTLEQKMASMSQTLAVAASPRPTLKHETGWVRDPDPALVVVTSTRGAKFTRTSLLGALEDILKSTTMSIKDLEISENTIAGRYLVKLMGRLVLVLLALTSFSMPFVRVMDRGIALKDSPQMAMWYLYSSHVTKTFGALQRSQLSGEPSDSLSSLAASDMLTRRSGPSGPITLTSYD